MCCSATLEGGGAHTVHTRCATWLEHFCAHGLACVWVHVSVIVPCSKVAAGIWGVGTLNLHPSPSLQEGEPSYTALLQQGAANGDGTALLPLDAAVALLPASLGEFGIKHVEFEQQQQQQQQQQQLKLEHGGGSGGVGSSGGGGGSSGSGPSPAAGAQPGSPPGGREGDAGQPA